MPGTKKSGRPGGNPDIAHYGFKIADSERHEPYTAHIALKVTASLKAQLKSLGPDWPSFVREAIVEKLERDRQKQR